jgi:DNA (cytosine-5)-methyltransferase 1
LFSGIGGLDLAAEWAGFETVATCEIDKYCRKVLKKNFPKATHFKDVRTITEHALRRAGIGQPDLVSAGFPCQPFSVAGSRKGTGDERHLWPEVARVLRETRPRWFLGENVRGLLSIDDGRVFGSILGDLASLGYRVGWGCYGADEAAGAPHQRARVFIVGHLADPSSERRNGEPVLLQRKRDSVEAPRGGNSMGSFPPGPISVVRWAGILAVRPDLAPALTPDQEIELQVQPVVDGVSRRLALKMIGNAVCPQQVFPILEAIAESHRRLAN